jgi:hypothetical protein
MDCIVKSHMIQCNMIQPRAWFPPLDKLSSHRSGSSEASQKFAYA